MDFVFVAGCPRSGTTVTMQILYAMGAAVGAVSKKMEHLPIRHRVIQPYLQSIEADPRGQDPLPDPTDIYLVDDFREQVLACIKHTNGPKPFALKILKSVFLWPLWRRAFPEAKWVIVLRRRDAIAQSCIRTSWMNAFERYDEWWQYATHYHTELWKVHRRTPKGQVAVIWPHDAITKDVGEYRPIVEFAGLTWNRGRAERIIKPEKWHG